MSNEILALSVVVHSMECVNDQRHDVPGACKGIYGSYMRIYFLIHVEGENLQYYKKLSNPV